MGCDWWIIIKGDKGLKLCILITGLGTGGAENHLLKILPRLNFPLFVISLTNENSTGKLLEEKGIKVYYLGLEKSLYNILSVVLRFRRVIKKEKPTILNSYLIHSNLFGRVFGRMFGVKRIICSVRNKHINSPFLNFIDKATSGMVNLYLPNSNAVAKFMIEKIGIAKRKIMVLPNGIDFDNFPYISEIEKKSLKKKLEIKGKKVIGTIGNLKPKKDHATLIKAFASLGDNYVLLIIGEGELKGKLESLSKELGIFDRVKFLGQRNDAKEILQVMDIFVLPSLHEGMSNALLEAMACERNIVVSDIEENKELIEDGKNGLVFKVMDEKNLSEKLIEISRSKERYGEKAISDILNKYDIRKIVKKYEGIIK